jgi:nucleoid-associated protein YgaU
LPGSAGMKLDTLKAEKDEPQETPMEEEVKRDTVTIQAQETVEPMPQVLAKVKIEPGSRLTLISLEYYGSKIFWVYLYEFNKSEIKDPNNIPVGTEIQVPAPEVYGIDKNSRASVDKAALRQAEILNGGQSSNSQAR